MNKLDHVVTNNIKNINQYDDAIEYDPKLDGKFSLSSGTNRDLLTVVTVSLRGGKKHRETIIYGLTCIWDSVYTKIMIKRQHNKP